MLFFHFFPVMCLYGVTGRSGHVDRTLQSVLPELQCLSIDRTRPVTISPHWNLTGVDRTLGPNIRSLTSSASGSTRQNHLGQMN